MLSPTYEITTALSHTDELISPPYDIAIVTISYGRVIMSSVWDSMMSKKNVGWPFYAAVENKCAHFCSELNSLLWDMGQARCGICDIGWVFTIPWNMKNANNQHGTSNLLTRLNTNVTHKTKYGNWIELILINMNFYSSSHDWFYKQIFVVRTRHVNNILCYITWTSNKHHGASNHRQIKCLNSLFNYNKSTSKPRTTVSVWGTTQRGAQVAISLTWINFNPSTDKYSHAQ